MTCKHVVKEREQQSIQCGQSLTAANCCANAFVDNGLRIKEPAHNVTERRPRIAGATTDHCESFLIIMATTKRFAARSTNHHRLVLLLLATICHGDQPPRGSDRVGDTEAEPAAAASSSSPLSSSASRTPPQRKVAGQGCSAQWSKLGELLTPECKAYHRSLPADQTLQILNPGP